MKEIKKDNNINKDSNIPLHQQVYLNIKRTIDSGQYKVGDKLCSESEYQKKFGVSRITVRRALSDLQHDGVIKRIKGVGTKVAPTSKETSLDSFNSFSSRARAEGQVPGSILLVAEKVIGTVNVCNKLKIEIGSEVFFLKRLRLLDGEIVSLHDTYIPLNRGVEIIASDFEDDTSLYEYIENSGVILGSAVEILQSSNPSKEIIKHLNLNDKTPIMYKERVTYTDNDLPIEYSENYYEGDKYKYRIHLEKVG